MSEAGLQGLAARQQALVAALTGTGAVPTGFDAAAVETARQGLLKKRASELRFSWPILTAALGERGAPLFAEFAETRPTRGSWIDGHDFAVWLRERGDLPLAAALELAEAEIHWVFPADGNPRRHTGRVAVASFPGGRLVRVGRRVRQYGMPRV